LNVFAGFAIFFWIVTPGLYYANVWFTAYLPICTADLYDNTAAVYNVTRVMNLDGTFNVAEYESYSPPFLPATFAFVYGISFAALTAVPVHIYLWHGQQIMDAFKGRTKLDIHARLMRLYPRIPWHWYGCLSVIIMVLAMVMVHVYQTSLPVWAILLASLIPAIYMIPVGIIIAITNVDANQLNVLAEFIGGYMFSGKPLASTFSPAFLPSFQSLLKNRRHDLQDPLYRCGGTRSLFCPRYETGALSQSPTSNLVLRPRKCNNKCSIQSVNLKY
jgi:OPT family oligopeptide transporter